MTCADEVNVTIEQDAISLTLTGETARKYLQVERDPEQKGEWIWAMYILGYAERAKTQWLRTYPDCGEAPIAKLYVVEEHKDVQV